MAELSSFRPSYVGCLDAMTTLIGSLLIWTGLRMFQDSQALARTFGLPKATPHELIVFQSATGRNIGAGIFVWIMTYLHDRKVLGIFLLCWTWAGIVDSKLLYEHPGGHKVGEHVRNTVILTILGPLLIASAK